ncbi:MAG: glycogen/starch/alpha-glucan phosphorylase, partial [Clostridia bacterium]
MYPERFTNVTNGIAHRRWLCNSNTRLSSLLDGLIGTGYRKNASELEKLSEYRDNESVLQSLEAVKRLNKVDFSNYISKTTGIALDPDSIFDVQVKRLHEYKRQLMNALHIASIYLKLKENSNLEMRPRTFIFGAKAAPGYYLAKDIIRFICYISAEIEKDPKIKKKLRVIFLENYNVSLAERLIPASDV